MKIINNIHVPRLNVHKASRRAILMFYWISRLVARSNSDSDGPRRKSDDWIDVASKALRKRFGARYLRVLNELVELKWIVRGTAYSNSATSWDGNGFSKGIKITDEAVKSGFASRTVCLTAKEEARFARCDKSDMSDPDIRYAVKQQESITLAGGYKRAIADEVTLRLKRAGKSEDLIEKVRRWELQALTTSGAVADRSWWVTKCVGHRVHTPITSMPGIIRDYLECDGEELVKLDISNSQPAILGGYLRLFQRSTNDEIMDLLRLWDSLPAKDGKRMRKIVHDSEYASKMSELVHGSDEWKTYHKRYVSRSRYERNLDARAARIKAAVMNETAVNFYCRSVVSGKFYQEIADEAKMPYPEAKKEIKPAVLKVFYEKTENQKDSPIMRAIENLFGVAIQVLKEIKTESYPAAAIAMTRKESEIMHCDELKALSAVYVHDEINAKKNLKEEAEKVFKARLNENQVECKVSCSNQERTHYEELVSINPSKLLSNLDPNRGNHSYLDYSDINSKLDYQSISIIGESSKQSTPSLTTTTTATTAISSATTASTTTSSASHRPLLYNLYVAKENHGKGDARQIHRTKSAPKQHTVGVQSAGTEYTGTEARPPPWR